MPPLLPMRVVLDRNRGGSYLALTIAGAAMFGVFLFLTYYLVGVLGFSAIRAGLAFLPLIVGIMASAITSGMRLTPRFGPRPVVTAGALIAAGGMLYLTRLGLGSAYAPDVLPGLLVAGLGMGMIFSPTQNAATAGARPGGHTGTGWSEPAAGLADARPDGPDRSVDGHPVGG